MSGGVITQVAESAGRRDGRGPWIGPGLVDLQINGYLGHDFNHDPLCASTVVGASEALSSQGVTSYFPTLITNSEHAIRRAVRAINRASSCAGAGGIVAGIHLEGPFISPEDGPRGAHDKAHVRPPDWAMFQRWQEAAGGSIRMVTLSPEWEGSLRFIERCVQSGVLVSLGHTGASPEQIADAIDAGARMSTHLGNGMHLVLPRHPNYLWEQLASDGLWASVIADGRHLPPSVLKVILRVKGDKAILVSDAVCVSGLEPGEYELHIGGRVVLTPDGRLHLAEQPGLLAGSVITLPVAISYLVRNGLSSLADAWAMASTRPASAAGLATAGGLEPGLPADVTLFDWDDKEVTVRAGYKGGRLIYQAPSRVGDA